MQRTELNSPLGLEVQLHITEAICPAISEPGNVPNVYRSLDSLVLNIWCTYIARS